MENTILNSKPLNVFVVISETLEGWRSPHSEEGKKVLLQHYSWGEMLKTSGRLILAGPTDFELTSTNQINPIGHTTGIIMIKASSREEAEQLAFMDPFHTNGYRINRVYSFKITMTNDALFETLDQLIQ